ncbi:MAG: hypothetical protein KDD63_12090 [Bacteroidetes bacterium]|nr:hypothetical protein [Bacteroidota bacterium]
MPEDLNGHNKKTSPVWDKRIKNAIHRLGNEATIGEAAFQHSVLCQTSFPYRDPKDQNFWKKEQGNVSLSV